MLYDRGKIPAHVGSPLFWFFVALQLLRAEKKLYEVQFLSNPTGENYRRLAGAVVPAAADIEAKRKKAALEYMEQMYKAGPVVVQSQVPIQEKKPARPKKAPIRKR